MKAKVIKEFTDKYTKIRHSVDSVFEGTKERVEELAGKGIVEVEQPKKKSGTNTK